MSEQPRGREKNVTGKGKPIEKRGEGLGTGPVGRGEGYSSRQTQQGPSGQRNGGSSPNTTRSGGFKFGIILVIIAVLFGGGFGLNNLIGSDTPSNKPGTNNGSSFSGFTNSSVSSGWITSANTAKLDTTVADGARDKRTVLYGGGRDKVTVMVYMCGTDLESKNGMASSDLKEMAKAYLSSNVNVLVYTGGCKNWKTSGISNSVNQIYKIENGSLKTLVRNDGSDPMTKPATLTRFINYCKSNYPANRNILVLWDHGGGSISGFGYDEKNPTSGSMTLKGINDALSSAGVQFDFIGFDACLMGTLETALTLEPYADYLIGSEETEPGVGWYHTGWLTSLSQNTAISTPELGKIIVDDFVSYCNKNCPGQKTTLSLTDLAELSATVPEEFSEFASETAETINSDDYKSVSDARAKTREFAVSSKSDQIDLVHLAYNIGTDSAKDLASAVLGAVKYNRTSSAVTNAYGLSIYFPYKKTSRVPNALKAYESIGIDSNYTECIRSFAGLEAAGQIVASDSCEQSPMPSLFGSFTGQSAQSSVDISSLLGGILGNSSSGSSSLSGAAQLASIFMGRSFDVESASDYIALNQLETSGFSWRKTRDGYAIPISEEQWSQVHSVQLNVFYDDGEGYIDLGLDNVYKIGESGELISDFDGTWLAIDNQPVPYYYIDTFDDGENYSITGRAPVLLNGERANLILVFDNDNPYGYIAGARYDYTEGETDTVAKGVQSLTAGDKIEFVCDYYSYDGEYLDSYLIGDELIFNGEHVISNVEIDEDSCSALYLLTDIYNNECFTPVVPD